MPILIIVSIPVMTRGYMYNGVDVILCPGTVDVSGQMYQAYWCPLNNSINGVTLDCCPILPDSPVSPYDVCKVSNGVASCCITGYYCGGECCSSEYCCNGVCQPGVPCNTGPCYPLGGTVCEYDQGLCCFSYGSQTNGSCCPSGHCCYYSNFLTGQIGSQSCCGLTCCNDTTQICCGDYSCCLIANETCGGVNNTECVPIPATPTPSPFPSSSPSSSPSPSPVA